MKKTNSISKAPFNSCTFLNHSKLWLKSFSTTKKQPINKKEYKLHVILLWEKEQEALLFLLPSKSSKQLTNLKDHSTLLQLGPATWWVHSVVITDDQNYENKVQVVSSQISQSLKACDLCCPSRCIMGRHTLHRVKDGGWGGGGVGLWMHRRGVCWSVYS